MRSTKRRLAGGALAIAAVSAGIFTFVMPASAEQHTLVVTLATGQKITVTVDVPPGTPVDQIKIPGVSGPVVSVQDVTAPSQPSAPPAQVGVQTQPDQQQPPQATPEAPQPADQGQSQQQQKPQKQTGKAKRK